MFTDVLFVFDELVAQRLFEVSADALQARNAIDDVACEVKSVEVIQDSHIEGSGRCSFFFVSADMEIVVVGAPIG